MLLTIDIGNTNIVIAVYDSEDLLFISRLETNKKRTGDQYAVEIKSIFDLHNVALSKIEGAIISSVVPEITSALKSAIKFLIGVTPMIVGPGLKTGMNILIDNPVQVGSDLVAGAVAAINSYPLPALVIDLGTATKISVVNENGAFCGGIIAPGVTVSLDALSKSASQLPTISLENVGPAIGKNTVDCMRSGIVYGTAAMLDGLCDKIESELNVKVQTIVATGGLAKDIVKHCRRKLILNENLIVHGLKCLFEKNSK